MVVFHVSTFILHLQLGGVFVLVETGWWIRTDLNTALFLHRPKGIQYSQNHNTHVAEYCYTHAHNIQLREKKPVWGNDCTHCMACIGNCPVEAIEYGTISQQKEPYRFGKYRYVIDNLTK